MSKVSDLRKEATAIRAKKCPPSASKLNKTELIKYIQKHGSTPSSAGPVAPKKKILKKATFSQVWKEAIKGDWEVEKGKKNIKVNKYLGGYLSLVKEDASEYDVDAGHMMAKAKHWTENRFWDNNIKGKRGLTKSEMVEKMRTWWGTPQKVDEDKMFGSATGGGGYNLIQ